jgi:hypothetical protein
VDGSGPFDSALIGDGRIGEDHIRVAKVGDEACSVGQSIEPRRSVHDRISVWLHQ